MLILDSGLTLLFFIKFQSSAKLLLLDETWPLQTQLVDQIIVAVK